MNRNIRNNASSVYIVNDFGTTQKNLKYDKVDTDAGDWSAFLVMLHKATKGEVFTAKRFVEISERPEVRESLPSRIMEAVNKPGFIRLVGTELAKKENRRYEAGDDYPGMDYTIAVSKDKRTKTNLYQVALVKRGQKTIV